MKNFEEVIDYLMSNEGESELIIDAGKLTDIDRSVIIDTLEDSGYDVSMSYGDTKLHAFKRGGKND